MEASDMPVDRERAGEEATAVPAVPLEQSAD